MALNRCSTQDPLEARGLVGLWGPPAEIKPNCCFYGCCIDGLSLSADGLPSCDIHVALSDISRAATLMSRTSMVKCERRPSRDVHVALSDISRAATLTSRTMKAGPSLNPLTVLTQRTRKIVLLHPLPIRPICVAVPDLAQRVLVDVAEHVLALPVDAAEHDVAVP